MVPLVDTLKPPWSGGNGNRLTGRKIDVSLVSRFYGTLIPHYNRFGLLVAREGALLKGGASSSFMLYLINCASPPESKQ